MYRRLADQEIREEGHKGDELDAGGYQVAEYPAYRHRQAREVHLAEQPGVAGKHVGRVVEAGGKVSPQHGTAVIEQQARYAVRAYLGKLAEHEVVHDRRHEGVHDKPQGPQYGLLVHGAEVALDEQPDQVPVTHQLAQVQVQYLVLGLYDQVPALFVLGRVAHCFSESVDSSR